MLRETSCVAFIPLLEQSGINTNGKPIRFQTVPRTNIIKMTRNNEEAPVIPYASGPERFSGERRIECRNSRHHILVIMKLRV